MFLLDDKWDELMDSKQVLKKGNIVHIKIEFDLINFSSNRFNSLYEDLCS